MSCSDCKKTLVHVHCAHGLDKCPFCRGVNFSGKSRQESQFLLTQYQRCEGPEAAVTIIIELHNNYKEEMLKAVSYVHRTIACTACISSPSSSSLLSRTISLYRLREKDDSPPTCWKCLNPVPAEDLVLLNFGNFRNFEDINLNTDEGIFLDGALKITKSIKSHFNIRGRICRNTDFERIVCHLKEENKMVNNFFPKLIFQKFSLDDHRTNSRTRAS